MQVDDLVEELQASDRNRVWYCDCCKYRVKTSPSRLLTGKQEGFVFILNFYRLIICGSSVKEQIVATPLSKENTVIKLSSTEYME